MQAQTPEVSSEKANTRHPSFNEAARAVIENQRASITFLQRRLAIGYYTAAQLIEELEQAGIVSSMNSSGSRSVLKLEVPNVD